MKGKNRIRSYFSPKTFVLTFCAIILLATFAVIISGKTQQPTTSYTAGVDKINFTKSGQDIVALGKTITNSGKSGETITQAKELIARTIGEKPYDKDVATLTADEIQNSDTQKNLSLIPTAIRMASLCQENPTIQCKQHIKILGQKIDIAERLIKLYMIETMIPDLCVKADLGTKPHMNATTVQGNDPGTKTRLYICTGTPGDIKFRSPARSGTLTRVKETFTVSDITPKAQKVADCVLQTPLTEQCDLKID